MAMTKADRIAVYKAFMPDELTTPDIVARLDDLGFFTAPASTKRHGAYEGGLFDHSFMVAKTLTEFTDKLNAKWQYKRSPYLVGMFHDLCKCEFYEQHEDGTYTYKKNLLIPGHGDRSVIMLTHRFPEFIPSEEEILCIRWHMGAYETDTNLWNSYGEAVSKYPNVLFTHTADMYASKVIGI